MKKVIFISLLFLLAFTAGCSVSGSSDESAGNVSVSGPDTAAAGDTAPGPPEFAPTADPRTDVEKMADRFAGLPFFRAKMTTQGPTPITTEMEYAAPDRYRIRSSSAIEMIVVGPATYMRINDRWQLMALPIDSSVAEIRSAFGKEGSRWFDNVKHVGEESVAGKPAYVYTYRGKSPDGAGENESKLWVSKAKGLPLKVESAYKAGTLKTISIEYDYDTPVSIEAPADARPARGGYNYPGT